MPRNLENLQLTIPGTVSAGRPGTGRLKTLDGEQVSYEVASRDSSEFTDRPQLWGEETVITRTTDGTLLVSDIIATRHDIIRVSQSPGRVSLETAIISYFIRDEHMYAAEREEYLAKMALRIASD